MIIFNTLAKATHYVKHKNKQYSTYSNGPYFNNEEYEYYYTKNKRVLKLSGWKCGCGCDRGSNNTTVVGKIKLVTT